MLSALLLLVALTAACTEDDLSFLEPPQTVTTEAGPAYAADHRKFQGIPSLTRTAGGRLWATWYASRTDGEDLNNYVIAATRGADARAWVDPVLVIDPDGEGPVRAFDPQIWVDPDGRLWLFWAQAIEHDGAVAGVWAVTAESGEAASPVWSAPRRLTDGIMMGKPLVLSTGEWVLPVSTWEYTDRSAKMVVSTDGGATWAVRGACNVPPAMRVFDEHQIIERRDGSLWMLLRSNTGFLLESVSTDRGATWPDAKPSSIEHPSSRFFVRRLGSGRLLMVKHHHTSSRDHLAALVSEDDGATWSSGLMLDERAKVSYPDGVEGEDGMIYVIYDRNRASDKEILMAVFSEADALAGEPSKTTHLRILVSKGSG
jgi:predicted neuraminidase